MNIVGAREFVLPEFRLVGVYILLRGDEVMYVGASKHLAQRYLTHTSTESRRVKRRRWTFDRMLWIQLDHADLSAYEGALARALNPEHTWRVSGDKTRDAEILERLGLMPDETRAFERRITKYMASIGRRVRCANRERKRRIARRELAEARVQRFVEAA